MKLGLRSQLLLGLAGLAVAGMAITGAITLAVAQADLREPMLDAVRATARAAADLVAAARDPARPLAEQTEPLRLIATRMAGAAQVDEIAICDREGRVLAASHRSLAEARFAEPPLLLVVEGGAPLEITDRDTVTIYRPIRDSAPPRTVAVVRVQATIGPIPAALAPSWRLLAILTALDGVVLILAAAFVLARYVVRPIERLRASSSRAAEGDLGHTVAVEGAGEIADLEREFNRMSLSLADHVRRLSETQEHLIRSEKLASVGQLAAGVAHEVGNPLAAILGYTEVLRAGDLPAEEAHDLLDRVARETRRIHETIRGLLDYSRPVRDAIEPVDLASVLGAAIALVRPQPRLRDVRIDRDLPGDLPPVSASTNRITQVLVNLLLNAADAMGGVGAVRVSARVEVGGTAVQVRIADEGPGVPAELRERIFDPFFTTKEPGQGTGLGLALCRSILENYRGTLALDGSSERGATFVLTLPACEPSTRRSCTPAPAR